MSRYGGQSNNGGLLTLLSLLVSQNPELQQQDSTVYSVHGPTHHHFHHQPFTPIEACFSHGGESGVCQSLVECARRNNNLHFLRHSVCQLSQHTRGVCCPLEESSEEKDPMVYAGLSVEGQTRNKSIVFYPSTEISTEDLNAACEVALVQMKARKRFERELVKRNIIAPKHSATFWHARLFQTTERIYLLGSDATLILLASISLVQRFTLPRDQVYPTLVQNSVSNTILKDTCPQQPPCVETGYKYRTYDGTCNNLLHYEWGTAGVTMTRLLEPYYQDGASVPRLALSGRPLPSSRLISTVVHPEKPARYKNFTLLLMQWGQFLDHDITHTPLTKGSAFSDVSCCEGGIYRSSNNLHPECFPIQIPENDTFYGQYNQKCMDFVRSMPAVRPHCTFGPREQMNQITSYIDGSAVYGSSEEEAKYLRGFMGGRLKVSGSHGNELLPPNPPECQADAKEKFCFKAGDSRVNEQPQLTTMHTLWVRQHNSIVKRLARLNPAWSDETLYQEGRRIVIAQIQHITYNEFLPIVLGRRFMSIYKLLPSSNKFFRGYNDEVDATILNAFSTAAFRFGHSLVPDHFKMFKRNGRIKKKLELEDVQFVPFSLYQKDGVASLLRGLIRQTPRKFDRHFVGELTDKLFAFGHPFGLDLVAMNIQRGRDHGLPPYVEWRKFCELKPAESWEDLLVDMDQEVIDSLKSVYEDIKDVDLFVGGISEKPLNDSIVGPTFLCIMAKQFIRLKFGDRFFYENAPDPKYSRDVTAFTKAQLNQIRKTSFARVLCTSGGRVGSIQPLAFLTPNAMNQRVSCRLGAKIPHFNLFPWKVKTMQTMNSQGAD